MKKIFYIILIPLLLWTTNSISQTISGTIVDSESGEPIPFLTVLNTQTKTGVITDVKGSFKIEATIQSDSLKFSGLGYQELTLIAQGTMKVNLIPSILNLGEVVISTNREQEKRTEAPVAISSISLGTIEDNKPTSIDQVLNQTPGVNMVDLGNEQHTMSIRRPIDYGASYLYLEDGIPIRTSGVFNHNSLLEINMANINRIEIIRGPASSMYGSEAIGGAVNFISKRPTLTPTAGISIQGNNLVYKRTDFYTSTTIKEKLGIRIGGYYANQTNGTLAYSDFNKLALSFSANYYVNDNTELIWSNSYINYYSDMSGSLDSLSFYSKSYGSNQTFTYRKVGALRSKLALNHYWNKKAKTSFTGFIRNNSIEQNPSYRVKDDFKPWSGQGNPNLAHGEINDNSFNSFGLIAQHKQDFTFLNSNLIIGGSIDYSPNTYNANYISINKGSNGMYQSYNETDSVLADYQANILNAAAYTQLKFEPIKNLQVIAALRFDNFNYSFDNNLGSNAFTSVLDGNNSFNRATPKVGVTYDLKKNRGIYANFSEGFVPPQVTTLYVGNDIPSLKPVYYDNFEVGGWASIFKDKAKVELSLYRMDGLNEIISVLQSDGSTLQQNSGRTTHQGIEYSLLTSLHKDVVFRISGTNAIHQFTYYVEGGIDFSDKSMPQSPNWIFNTQLTYKPSFFKGFRASIEWQHIDKYFMDQLNTKSYEGYNLFNLRLGYERKSWEIWTNIMNVSNELYATVARSTAWGQTYSLGNPRSINIGLSYKFKKK